MTEIQRLARVVAKAVIGDATHVDLMDDHALRFYADGVRALLLEIREPTEAMVIAGCRHENMGDMAGRWQAMVDELLK